MELMPPRASVECFTQQSSDYLCGVNRLAESLLAVMALIYAWFT